MKFDHVSFRYPGAEEDVLHDINFVAQPGETTALIGSTGSGKSTLVNLIPRFYDVTEGSITIDGEAIRNITQHELRDRLGYVPQKGVLFSGTIESNILYGNPDGSETEMKEAAAIAQASDSSKKRTKNMKAESHRVVQMYQVDRNSVCQSRVPLQNSRMCLFSMTAFSIGL